MLPLLLTLLALYASISNVYAQDSNTIETKQSKLESVKQKLSEAKNRLNTQLNSKRGLENKLKKAELEIGELSLSFNKLQAQSSNLARQYQTAKQKEKKLDRTTNQLRDDIAQQLNVAYRIHEPNPAAIVLGHQSVAMTDLKLSHLATLGESRQQKLTEYNALLQQHKTLQASIDNNRKENALLQTNLSNKKQRLEQLQMQRRQHIVALNEKISANRTQVFQLGEEQKILGELIAKLQKEQQIREAAAETERQTAATTINTSSGSVQRKEPPLIGFKKAKGQLPWPIQGKLQNPFGSKSAGTSIKSKGVTIAASQGAQVQAIYPGKVIFADWFRGQGLLMIIDHGEGYYSLYGHNQSLLHEPGNFVAAGQAIATAGNSGGQRDSALYFEIRANGSPQNPKHWCVRT